MRLFLFAVVLLTRCARSAVSGRGDVYSNHWAVRVSGGPQQADRVAAKYGYVNMGQIGSLDNHYHFHHSRVVRRAAYSQKGPHQFIHMDPEVRNHRRPYEAVSRAVLTALWALGKAVYWGPYHNYCRNYYWLEVSGLQDVFHLHKSKTVQTMLTQCLGGRDATVLGKTVYRAQDSCPYGPRVFSFAIDSLSLHKYVSVQCGEAPPLSERQRTETRVSAWKPAPAISAYIRPAT